MSAGQKPTLCPSPACEVNSILLLQRALSHKVLNINSAMFPRHCIQLLSQHLPSAMFAGLDKQFVLIPVDFTPMPQQIRQRGCITGNALVLQFGVA